MGVVPTRPVLELVVALPEVVLAPLLLPAVPVLPLVLERVEEFVVLDGV